MRDVFLADGLRTPIGKYGGILAGIRPDDLLALALRELAGRNGLSGGELDEVAAGNANQAGEDNRNVARMSALLAGLPVEVPALTFNRLCASGLSAIVHCYRAIAVGEADLMIGGGVESMTRAPLVMMKSARPWARGVPEMHDSSFGWRFVNERLAAAHPPLAMGETAEILAERYGIEREEQDEFALRSHRLALEAWKEGRYDRQVVPVQVGESDGEPLFAREDEGPRPDTSLEALASLPPVFKEGGTVTAGNASSLNDGAAAVLVASREACERYGLKPIARVMASGQVGVDPSVMGLGPVGATRMALARARWDLDDLDSVEINEAFAAQVLAVLRELPVPLHKINPDGGAIALGHPLGMSGARLVVTLLDRMRRDPSVRRGLATLCVGVGQGESLLVESAAA